MAKKKQEIALMREIESQEEWEDVMGKEGLWVVDVYQEWSGPCDAMVSNFRRIKNELGDDLLHFANAKSDTIESLEKYRGSCEPCFLFFAAGVMVSFVHGANSPLILRTLTEQLAQEHKVQDGSSERKEVKDPFVANREAAEPGQDEEEEEAETVEQGYTVAIIKPNVVADGKVDDILAEMKARGIDVIAQEERQLTEEEAREFYSHLKDEEYFNDLVGFMASGPSHVLVLTKGQEDDSVIRDWRDLLGPPTVEDAKEQAPESLRAKYGQAGLMNALHGSDSKETAARELAFFFPHMNAPTIHKKKKEVQRTLALIRPDAFANNREAILERIKEAGFQIALQKEVVLTKEQAEEFYKEHAGQPYFDELTNRMSSGPLLALGLAREDAVENWRGLLGPTDVEEAKTSAPDSLRAQFAVEDAPINQLHGSDSVEAAQKELNFFFPVEQTVAMIKPDAIGTKDAIVEKIHQAGFRIAARKESNITREIAESFYEDQRDKEFFNDLVEHMISGPTMFMVLSREGAVEGWREEIGPTDPATAKETAPNSLRAQFGTDVLKNAVHGASTATEAQKKIHAVFGNLEFNPDGGTIQEEEEQAEQQQQEQQPEQEAKAEEQAEQQAEQPAEAEGQAEGEGQSEEKPAEGEGEAAEKKEGEVEEKPSEQAADSAEKEKDESAEKAKGGADEKPAEQAAEGAEKDSAEKETAEKDSAEKETAEKDTAEKDSAEKDKEEKDEDAGQAAQQKAEEPEEAAGDKSNNAKAEEPKDESNNAKAEEPKEEAKDTKAEEQKEEAKDTKAEEQKEEAKDTKAEEQKEEAKDTKEEEQKEEAKDTKAEEQKDEQKEEEGKAEQKEDAAEAKKEGEEGKTEA